MKLTRKEFHEIIHIAHTRGVSSALKTANQYDDSPLVRELGEILLLLDPEPEPANRGL